MQVRPPKRRYVTGIGYASLTDIVLLLLIFFLLSSSFVLRPGLKIRLPAGEATEETTSSPITVTLSATGEIYVDQVRVERFEQIGAALLRRLEGGAEPTVVLEADREIALKHAVSVLDQARQQGVERLVIATEAPEGIR